MNPTVRMRFLAFALALFSLSCAPAHSQAPAPINSKI